jgi:phage major head subunit gpT-like protein
MDITPSNLKLLFQQFDRQFNAMFGATEVCWPLYASEFPSKTKQTVYGWLAQFGGMRKWEGSRQAVDAVGRSYTLTNIPFERTVELDRDDIFFDQYGFFGAVVENLAMAAKTLQDQETADAITHGVSRVCWDGQFFFDSDHPVNPDDPSLGYYENNLVGASYNFSTDPKGVWAKAKARMKSFKDDGGKPLNASPDTILCGPDLEDAALQVANAATIAQAIQNKAGSENVAGAGVTNVYAGKVNVVVSSWVGLADTSAMYALCTKKPVKPILWQNAKAAQLLARINPEDPKVFDMKKFTYGVDALGAAGYGLPWTAVRCAPS